jgi:nicotinate-nucleotide adenylyltransferase
MHIGILGGTFNPIHYGHLRIAEELREACHIEKIVFVPSYLPPHKEDIDLVSSQDRLEMVNLAIEENPYFDVSDVEVRREGLSYLIETLKELNSFYGSGALLSFIVGIDAFLEISTWKDYKQLFEHSNFIITGRLGYDKQQLNEVLPAAISKSIFWVGGENRHLFSGSRLSSKSFSIVYVETTHLDISSSMIRKKIKENKSIKYLLPPEVEDYIEIHRLYKEEDKAG